MNDTTSSTHDRATVDRRDDQLVITRRFRAPAELVFAALTQPQHVRQWWGSGHGEVTTCEVDLRVGGRWHFAQVTPDGSTVSFSGEYRELDPPGRMVHTEVFDNIGSLPALVETSLTEHEGVTELRAVITYDSSATVDAVIASGMEGGLQSSYDALDDVLERLAAG